jgi:hypothetical protein
MIGRVAATGEPQRVTGVRVRTSDGDRPLVDLVVEPITDGRDGRSLLRWELRPVSGSGHTSAGIGGPEEDRDPKPALALRLASAAVELELCQTREDLVGWVVDTAVRLIPHAQHAGLVLQFPGEVPAPAAATSEVARWADGVQLTERVGPVHLALMALTPVPSHRLHEEVWIGSSSSIGGSWPGCAIAVPLLVGARRFGVLTVYADEPQALDAEAELATTALSLHVAVALRRLIELTGLEEAVSTRQLVGQAVGILVERHRLTPEQAFTLLVRWSQHRNVKLRSIARTLVETGREPPPLRGS